MSLFVSLIRHISFLSNSSVFSVFLLLLLSNQFLASFPFTLLLITLSDQGFRHMKQIDCEIFSVLQNEFSNVYAS